MTDSMDNRMDDFDQNDKIVFKNVHVTQHQVFFQSLKQPRISYFFIYWLSSSHRSVTPPFIRFRSICSSKKKIKSFTKVTIGSDPITSYTLLSVDRFFHNRAQLYISDTRISNVLYRRSKQTTNDSSSMHSFSLECLAFIHRRVLPCMAIYI